MSRHPSAAEPFVAAGLDTIGYALTGDLMEPDKGTDHYTETLVRLANLATCYPDEAQCASAGSGRPASERSQFLCAQSLYKLLPADDDVFAQIAQDAGSCRVSFIAHLTDIVR